MLVSIRGSGVVQIISFNSVLSSILSYVISTTNFPVYYLHRRNKLIHYRKEKPYIIGRRKEDMQIVSQYSEKYCRVPMAYHLRSDIILISRNVCGTKYWRIKLVLPMLRGSHKIIYNRIRTLETKRVATKTNEIVISIS